MKTVDIEQLFKHMENVYSPESWKKFYKPKLEKFFFDYENRMPLERITKFDVEDFLSEFEQNSPIQLNYYNALNAFYAIAFEYAQVQNVMLEVPKPNVTKKEPKYVTKIDIRLLKDFISNTENKLNDRLLLGLVLFTGLPRRYIFDLQNGNIKKNGVSRYDIWISDENGDHRIPISKQLEEVIIEYLGVSRNMSPYSKIFSYAQDTAISFRIKTLTEKITSHAYSTNIIGNTFIKMALDKNPDVYSIGRIALKSVATI